MLYFMQQKESNRIKIGRGNVPRRLYDANTFSSEDVILLLAIHVANEDEAEKKLHAHFCEYRLNGEWFEINFSKAFRALLELKLVPDAHQPILELPVVQPVPPIHPEFRRWWFACSAWKDDEEGRRYMDEHIERLWGECYAAFETELRSHQGDVEAMLAVKIPPEENFKKVIEKLQSYEGQRR
jgi:hypothetical protein